jgi:DNA-binding LacI/PurR family transcriptional regulator
VEAAQEAIFDEIRTYGRPTTGYFAGQDVLFLGSAHECRAHHGEVRARIDLVGFDGCLR